MNAKDTVLALHSAYMTGDAERITALLHPEVIWVTPAGNATQVALGLGATDDAGATGLGQAVGSSPGREPISPPWVGSSSGVSPISTP